MEFDSYPLPYLAASLVVLARAVRYLLSRRNKTAGRKLRGRITLNLTQFEVRIDLEGRQ